MSDEILMKESTIQEKIFSWFKNHIKIILAVLAFLSFTLMFTWKFALLLMATIWWHEYGHVLAMRFIHLKNRGFFFVPFFGGMAVPKEHYSSYLDNSFVALAGPAAGMLLAIAFAVLYFITGIPMIAAIASWNAILNLLNLIPISPLDGGQVMRALTYSMHRYCGKLFLLTSYITGIYLSWHLGWVALILFLILGTLDIIFDFFVRDKMKLSRPSFMNWKQMLIIAFAYIGISIGLIGIVQYTNSIPNSSIQIQFMDEDD